MKPNEGTILLVFDGIHDVVRAERLLLARDIPCDLVPTPRDIATDCGMVVACRLADEDRLDALASEGLLRWRQRVRRGGGPG